MKAYQRYLKDKWTTLLVKIETKNKLNSIKYDLRVKSIDEVIKKLINTYERSKEM